MSKSDIVQLAVNKSKIMTWLIRVGTYLMMVIGICMFFSPITTILGFIPLVGGLLKGTVGFVILLAAVIVCIPLWIIGFSLAWLWYHPKVGVIFLGIGISILGVILYFNYSKQGSPQAA